MQSQQEMQMQSQLISQQSLQQPQLYFQQQQQQQQLQQQQLQQQQLQQQQQLLQFQTQQKEQPQQQPDQQDPQTNTQQKSSRISLSPSVDYKSNIPLDSINQKETFLQFVAQIPNHPLQKIAQRLLTVTDQSKSGKDVNGNSNGFVLTSSKIILILI